MMKITIQAIARKRMMPLLFCMLIPSVGAGTCLIRPHAEGGKANQPCYSEFALGGGAFFSTSPYRQHDDYTFPLPLFSCENDCFYIRGVDAGLYGYKDRHHALSAGISYSYLYFDPDETDDLLLKKLNPRHSTLLANVSYTWTSKWGRASLKVSRDALGYHDGTQWDLSYQYPIKFARWFLSPGVGITSESREFTRYYYGVSVREAAKTDLPTYRPDSSLTPYFSVDLSYTLFRNWFVIAGLKVSLLSSDVKDSPMVGRSNTWTGLIGVSYSF